MTLNIQRPEPLQLCAGHLTMFFEPDTAFLRRICSGRHEVIRCIYATVRDRNWGTVPTTITGLESSIGAQDFELRFEAACQQGNIDFQWAGILRGTSRGTVTFDFEGEARTRFLKNRIGFCVLHPQSCAGSRAWSENSGGVRCERRLPDLIEPQIRGQPPFGEIRELAHEYVSGAWATVRFSGDAFEMEDQRNWTDASFKTYCTPLALPYPVELKAGTRIRQSVTLKVEPAQGLLVSQATGREADVLELPLPGNQPFQMPELGLGLASHPEALTEKEKRRLAQLQLGHVRFDLDLADEHWPERLAEARDQLTTPLELAVHLPREVNPKAMGALREAFRNGTRRLLVFRKGEPATTSETLRLAKQHLAGCGVPIGGGTNAHFCQLNREQALGRIRPAETDFLGWPITPQFHASDNLSLMENLQAQGATVNTARAFAGGRPLCVTPVTLRPRSDAMASGEPDRAAGTLPGHVDPRQTSLFAAAWTLGSIAQMAKASAASVTYYETVGWGGLMERECGSPMPALFPSRPGMLYPMYYVFAWLAGYEQLALLDVPQDLVTAICLFKSGAAEKLIVADLAGKGLRFRFPRTIRRAYCLEIQSEAVERECQPESNSQWQLKPYGLLCLELTESTSASRSSRVL